MEARLKGSRFCLSTLQKSQPGRSNSAGDLVSPITIKGIFFSVQSFANWVRTGCLSFAMEVITSAFLLLMMLLIYEAFQFFFDLFETYFWFIAEILFSFLRFACNVLVKFSGRMNSGIDPPCPRNDRIKYAK